MLAPTETIEDDRIVAKCYVELGNVTKEKGEYDESLRYHRKSMEIFERIDDALSVADSHLNIAEIYKAKGELKQAMNEYEIGLTLYEDAYVEDGNKNSDSGTDVSLNSSSFSDLQHTKPLSKSDETLPQTTLTDIIENDVPLPSPLHSLNEVISTSTSSLNLPVSSTKKMNEFEDMAQLTTSMDDCSLIVSEKLINERRKSLLSSSTSDLQFVNANYMLFPSSPTDLVYETTGETTPEDSEILEICAPFLSRAEATDQDLRLLTTESLSLDTKLQDTNNSDLSTKVQENKVSNNTKQIVGPLRLWHRLPKKQFLIVLLSIFLTGVLFWSLHDNDSIKSLFSCSSSDFTVQEHSHTGDHDDLSEQLRKLLTWRKDRLASLNKDNRRMIEELLTNSGSRTKITVDKFQRILDMLDLKIVLIPQ